MKFFTIIRGKVGIVTGDDDLIDVITEVDTSIDGRTTHGRDIDDRKFMVSPRGNILSLIHI